MEDREDNNTWDGRGVMRRLEALGWGWRHRTCTAEGMSTRDRVGSAARLGLDTKVLGMGVDSS